MLESISKIISNMYQQGFTAEQIAAVFETDISTISYVLGSSTQNRKKSDIITPTVCDMYKKGISICSIASQLKISRTTVRFILRKEGLQKHKMTEQEAQAIQLVQSGLTYKETGIKLGIDANRVGQLLRLNGIEVEDKIKKFHQRKHHFNENFFDEIITEEQAYWLGFLYADGCVTDNGVVALVLAAKDKEHVIKFSQAVSYDTDPTYCRNTRSFRIDLCSRHMCRTLISLGCVSRKSLVLRFPLENQVPSFLIHHFMRGYFDGDGYVRVYEPKGLSRFEILGTPQFLDDYESILLSHCTNNSKTKRVTNKSWNENTQGIMYCGHRLKDIYRFLYQDATVYLNRKHDMFKQILTRPESKDTEDSGV